MAVVKELLRAEAEGAISFGNHKLEEKAKLDNFEHSGDLLKVKTYKTMTKLERNGMFVYESVPGTSVIGFKETEEGISFAVEGDEDAQITIGLQDETEYEVFINNESIGKMNTNLGGKLNLSVELAGAGEVNVRVEIRESENGAVMENDAPFLCTRAHEEIREVSMAKGKNSTVFFCQECGYESAKWMGQCPACKAWNTFVEEKVSPSAKGIGGAVKVGSSVKRAAEPSMLSQVSMSGEERIGTGLEELDRVLGGGIVPGSLTLVGGDPGIGKSTLLLQVCQKLADAGHKVLYISGEESLKQIKIRANRIGSFNDNLLLLCETNLDIIGETIRYSKPDTVIIDSIQTMYSEEVSAAPGSVSQVRESTNVFLQLAKGLNIPIFIVGHVTKEGTVAGPRVLEHMVDTVLYFEGDRHASYRILRGVKNRFGSTNEIGVFEMREEGLIEVKNPSEFMLNGRPEGASGSVVACSMEGTRPILIEIQALVCGSNFGIPRRQAIGTDFNRVNLLMAVLEKRVGLQMSSCDAYVNLAGGIKITEPAIDLGIVMAIVSSFKNRAIDDKMLVFGEVGLSGEVRAVSMAGQRVQEAKKLGFTTCVIPAVCVDSVKDIKGIKIIGAKSVQDAIDLI